MSETPWPYHRWQSNENVDHPASLDRCLACGVRRFSDDQVVAVRAAAACPGHRPGQGAHGSDHNPQPCGEGCLACPREEKRDG